MNKAYKTTYNDVQEIFSSIAGRYDLANSVLSAGAHRSWRRALLGMLPRHSIQSGGRVLDLCCGTGDFVALLESRYQNVIGADFCLPMLQASKNKRLRSVLVQADGLNLPFLDNSFSLITIGFGVRNFENLDRGLSELYRITEAGGRVLILEFGTPNTWFKPFYKLYSRYLMPMIGASITGNRSAYQYLPETSLKFPYAEEFCSKLAEAGFCKINFKALTFGIAYGYYAEKA